MRSRPAAWLTLYGRTYPALEDVAERDAFTAGEAEFIAPRDSFYMATLTGHGWPYLQHRGGAPGFLRVTGPNELLFADHGGNRQMIRFGNLAVKDRGSLFPMDDPARGH